MSTERLDRTRLLFRNGGCMMGKSSSSSFPSDRGKGYDNPDREVSYRPSPSREGAEVDVWGGTHRKMRSPLSHQAQLLVLISGSHVETWKSFPANILLVIHRSLVSRYLREYLG
jgi:hypothetical protein